MTTGTNLYRIYQQVRNIQTTGCPAIITLLQRLRLLVLHAATNCRTTPVRITTLPGTVGTDSAATHKQAPSSSPTRGGFKGPDNNSTSTVGHSLVGSLPASDDVDGTEQAKFCCPKYYTIDNKTYGQQTSEILQANQYYLRKY